MPSRILVSSVTVDVAKNALGAYAPARDLVATIQAFVLQAAREAAPQLVTTSVSDAPDLELRATFSRLEPDTLQRPFASAQVQIEVLRRATLTVIYTRKVESEVRRLIQSPVPLDDPRFARTALGRAATSCIRSALTAVADAFAGR